MHTCIAITAVLLVVTTPALTLPQVSRDGTLGVKWIWTIGDKPGQDLLQVGGAIMAKNGSVFIADRIDCSIKKFDTKGKHLGTYGRYGKSSGDLKGPMDVALGPGKVAIVDYLSAAIQVIDTGLAHLRTFQAKTFVSDVVFDSRGRLLVACLTDRPEELLSIYSPEGKLTTSISSPSARKDPLLNIVKVASTPDDKFVVAFEYNNVIEIYSSEGRLERSFSVPGLPAKPNMRPQPDGTTLPEGAIIRDVTVDVRGNLLILGGDYAKNISQDVFVMSMQGSSLAMVTLPQQAGFLSASQASCVLVREKQRTLVSAYSIQYP